MARPELFPMRTTPFNFSRGDVVKKIITDNVKTPYTGVVTSIVPSTNKIEVQWPHGMGIEDPWDLIKVNPLISPPTVKEDKAYKTYQNQLSHDYYEKIQPYNVIQDYIKEKVNPIILHASKLYNNGLDKQSTYLILKKSYDNERLVTEAVNKVFNANVNYALEKNKDNVHTSSTLSLTGNDVQGFKLIFKLGSKEKTLKFSDYREAMNNLKFYKGLYSSIGLSEVPEIVKNIFEDK